MARRRGGLTSWLAGGDLWLWQDVFPSEECLTVRAVWKARLVLNPAGTGDTGLSDGSPMDPGLRSVRTIGRVKGNESTVNIPCGIEAVRLPDRL